MASTLPLSAGGAQPPQARRLNRNAAIVAGAVLLVTLLVVVFLLTNSPTQASDARAAAPQALPSGPGPAEPGFLDRPPGEVLVPPAMGPAANGEPTAGTPHRLSSLGDGSVWRQLRKLGRPLRRLLWASPRAFGTRRAQRTGAGVPARPAIRHSGRRRRPGRRGLGRG